MTRTEVKGSFENSLKRFRLQVAKSGTPAEKKKREHYSKPGELRRIARENAIRNSRKQNRKNRNYD